MDNNPNTIKLIKDNQYEIIDVGDVIMIDTDTHKVTKAVFNEPGELICNSRIVVGVCVQSDNESPVIEILDGGLADEEERPKILDGGYSDDRQTSEITELFDGGTSQESSRKIIDIAYSGECIINTIGHVEVDDELCISPKAGKAKRKNYFDEEYFDIRSLGKVSECTEDNKIKIILNIE